MRWWAAALALLFTPPALAAGVAVDGADRARILPPAGAPVVAYDNAGYHLRLDRGEVTVEVDATPLASRARFAPPPRRADEGPVARLARAVTAGAETQYDAASRLLGWISRHLTYDLDRRQPQDAAAVLARRSGYCTGVARLSVALLRAVGIEAREVAGYVVAQGGEEATTGYHRWIEVYLPDRGWVFSDPLASHHYVPAVYLRLAGEVLDGTAAGPGLLLERQDGLVAVDLYPEGAAGVRARRNGSALRAASLELSAPGVAPRGVVILEGLRERRSRTLEHGPANFLGLEPGAYRWRLELDGRRLLAGEAELPGRVRKRLVVSAAGLVERRAPEDGVAAETTRRRP